MRFWHGVDLVELSNTTSLNDLVSYRVFPEDAGKNLIETDIYNRSPGFKAVFSYTPEPNEQLLWTSTSTDENKLVTRWTVMPEQTGTIFRTHTSVGPIQTETASAIAEKASIRCIRN